MLNCAGYFTRRDVRSARLGICVNGRSPLGFPYAKYRCIAPRNAPVPGYARPHPTASALFTFSCRVSLAVRAGRKSHAQRFASVSIVTSRPQRRVLIREMYSLSPGNVLLSRQDRYTRRKITPTKAANRQVASQRDSLIRFAACDSSFRLVTAPDNVRHACALPL